MQHHPPSPGQPRESAASPQADWLDDLALLLDGPLPSEAGGADADAGARIEAVLARLADPGTRADAGPAAEALERILGRLRIWVGEDQLRMQAELQKARFAAQHRRRDRTTPTGRLSGEAVALGRLLARALRAMPPWRRGRVFDAAYYRQRNPDVVMAGADPLRHYMSNGAEEGRLPADLGALAPDLWGGRPGTMAELPGCARPGLSEDFPAGLREDALRLVSVDPPAVSVVMPVRNRAGLIAEAIASALVQSLRPREVIVVDDGSIDGTPGLIRATFPEPLAEGRLVLVEQPHGGVSVARNAGLARARGEVIAYLDSDNSWESDHLLFACAGLRASGARMAYTALNRHNLDDHWSDILYRPFDRAALEAENYIDLNALVHERALTEALGGFDTGLTRLVDWDLVLRLSAEAPPVGLPIVTGHYLYGGALFGSITATEPLEANLARIRARLAEAGA